MGPPGGSLPMGTASHSDVVSAWCPAQGHTSKPGPRTSGMTTAQLLDVPGPVGVGSVPSGGGPRVTPALGVSGFRHPRPPGARMNPEPGLPAAPPPRCPGPAVPCDLVSSSAEATPLAPASHSPGGPACVPAVPSGQVSPRGPGLLPCPFCSAVPFAPEQPGCRGPPVPSAATSQGPSGAPGHGRSGVVAAGLCLPCPVRPLLKGHPVGLPHTFPGPVGWQSWAQPADMVRGLPRPWEPMCAVEGPGVGARGRCSQRGQEARGAGLWLGSWAGLWPLELTPCPRVAPGLRLSCGRPRVWWEVGADSVPSPRSWRGGVGRMGHCPLACRARGVAGGPAEGGHCVRKWPCRGH